MLVRIRHMVVAQWRAIAVFLVGVVLTGWLIQQLQSTVTATDRVRFSGAVERLNDQIVRRIDTYIATLRAGAALIDVTSGPEPADFRRFVQRLELQQRYPGIQGIGYSVRIADADLPAFIAARRRVGDLTFHVWPEFSRAEYHSILLLEPLDRRNSAAIGYDMFTDAVRREAMERARDSGEPAASGPVTLVQEIDPQKQHGFLIYVPVYRGGGVPASLEERRAQLLGFIYSPFRIGDLFAGILMTEANPRAGFELFDSRDNAASLYRAGDPTGARFQQDRTITIAGRPWRVAFFSLPGLDEVSDLHLVPIAATAGVTFTLLVTALVAAQTRTAERLRRSEVTAQEASMQYQQLANSIPQLAWMARPDGWIYWYNDRWYQYTGTTPEQMAGWGWRQVHDPNVLPRVLEQWRRSLTTGEPFDMEFPLRGADGQYRWFLTRTMPVRDSSGAIVQWFGTNTDVQDRRDAERRASEEAETLELVNQTGTRIAAELDLERLVQQVTDAGTLIVRAGFGAFFYNVVDARGEAYTLYALSGVPREAFSSFPMPRNTAVFGPTFRGEGIVRSDDITADPRYGHNPPYNGMPEGHLPVRSYLAVPVLSRSGEVLGGLFFGHEQPGVFTARDERVVAGIAAQAAIGIDNARLYRQVQDLLVGERAARAEAERMSRLKDEFLATLSHELRTPLNAIHGWAHLLVNASLPPDKQQQALATILRNSRVQAQLVDDLIDMSRIDSGRVRIDLVRVDLGDIIDAAINVVRPLADTKGIPIVTSVRHGDVAVSGDPRRLQQVFWNLLANAVKFTTAGGHVDVRLRRGDGVATVEVRDTGIGIEPAFLPHVFDRFRQADGSIARQYGGLGLGLSIVKSLVDLHGGHVEAFSEGRNCGSVFTVTLPLARGEAEPASTARPDHAAVATLAENALSGSTILVVDDDADARVLMADVLTHYGATVRVTGSAPDALALLDSEGAGIALLVSDIGMPEMDGHALMHEVRSRPWPLRSIPAIAVTAYAAQDEKARALAAGFDMHVAKPIVPHELVRACVTLVRSSKQPDAV